MSKVTVVSRPNRITIASKGVQGALGPQGEQGEQGIQGPKGDTGDVTPEAIAARDAAQEAASSAQESANLAEQARLLGATIGFATKADMDASLAHPAGTLALVTNDAMAANNGTYRKTGASGSGAWVQSADRVSGLEGRIFENELVTDHAASAVAKGGQTDLFTNTRGIDKRASLGGSTTAFNFSSASGGLSVVNTGSGARVFSLTMRRVRVGGDESYFVEVDAVELTTNPSWFGLSFGGPGTAQHFFWGSSGGFRQIAENEDATVHIANGQGPTFADGDTVALNIRVFRDGGAVVTLIRNGEAALSLPVAAGFGNGRVELSFRGQAQWLVRSFYSDGYPALVADELAALQAHVDEINSPQRVATINAAMQLLSSFERTQPPGGAAVNFKIYRPAEQKFFTDIEPESGVPFSDAQADFVAYVDPGAGNDSNSGTEAEPFRTLRHAVHLRTGRVLVLAKPALYDRLTGFSDANTRATALIIRPWGSGRIRASMHHSGLSWSLAAGMSNTYQATITTVGQVVDAANVLTNTKAQHAVDGGQDYGPLDLRGSVAEVEANPSSYYVSGTTVYVHTFNGRAPDSSVRVYENKRNFLFNAFVNGATVWVKDVDFEGGERPAQVASVNNIAFRAYGWFVNCTFKYSGYPRNAFNVDGDCWTYCFGCVASRSATDGFNYHSAGASAPPISFESNCVGRNNGGPEGGSHNGSTTHDGGQVRRIGGVYVDNKNRDLHDVNDAFSWNLGVTAGGAEVAVAAGALPGDSSIVYLDECVIEGSPVAFHTGIGGSDVAMIRTHNCDVSGGVAPGSNVSEYVA